MIFISRKEFNHEVDKRIDEIRYREYLDKKFEKLESRIANVEREMFDIQYKMNNGKYSTCARVDET